MTPPNPPRGRTAVRAVVALVLLAGAFVAVRLLVLTTGVEGPADLSIRPVLVVTAPGPAPHDLPSETELAELGLTNQVRPLLEILDCTQPAGVDVATEPEQPLVACAAGGDAKYVLGPVALTGADVATATANQVGDGWVVTVEFTEGGTAALAELTQRLVGAEPPRNRLALVLGDQVESAPEVRAVIAAGVAQIAVPDRETAETLAERIAGVA